jgi:hypothetical protein
LTALRKRSPRRSSLAELSASVAAPVAELCAMSDADLTELILCPCCTPRTIARGRASGGDEAW